MSKQKRRESVAVALLIKVWSGGYRELVCQFFREEKDFLFQREAEKERMIAEAKIREEKPAIAMKFKKLGISVTDIAKGTGLSADEIEGL